MNAVIVALAAGQVFQNKKPARKMKKWKKWKIEKWKNGKIWKNIFGKIEQLKILGKWKNEKMEN